MPQTQLNVLYIQTWVQTHHRCSYLMQATHAFVLFTIAGVASMLSSDTATAAMAQSNWTHWLTAEARMLLFTVCTQPPLTGERSLWECYFKTLIRVSEIRWRSIRRKNNINSPLLSDRKSLNVKVLWSHTQLAYDYKSSKFKSVISRIAIRRNTTLHKNDIDKETALNVNR